MAPVDVVARRAEVAVLCRRYGVRRLDLFGSAAETAGQNAGHDLDFLVEFAAPAAPDYADNFFGLMEALEALLGLPVDLVVPSSIRNPYFRDAVEAGRVQLYAA